MSARDWRPGDVAMVTHEAGEHRAIRVPNAWSLDSGWADCLSDDFVTSVRPLVVIDPEDREQVERLTALVREHRAGLAVDEKTIADALREFANPKPPKPEEPTGLGAVVEDASGVEHIHLGSGLWAYGTTDGPSGGLGYADISAVRVLSEGVIA